MDKGSRWEYDIPDAIQIMNLRDTFSDVHGTGITMTSSRQIDSGAERGYDTTYTDVNQLLW